MSYWQFKGKDEDVIRRRKLKHPDVRFMVDSGAHTFITDTAKFNTWSRTDFENYVKAYASWLKKNRQYIECAVEFDIDYPLNLLLGGSVNSTIGGSIVKGWQDTYFKPLEDKGLNVVYVWHIERGMGGWEDMNRDFSYVGLPGFMSKEADFNKYISVSKKTTSKIHGFAATKQLDFRDIPWYSIDSITWKTGEMYGTLIDWNPWTQRLTFQEKDKRPLFRQKFIENGFDAEAIISDTNYKEVTRYSLWSMRQMELFYVDRYKDRTFYYELRLPKPHVAMFMPEGMAREFWAKFRPEQIFKQHKEADIQTIRTGLAAIAAVQNMDANWLGTNPACLDFLKAYFPKLTDPLISDLSVFQREMAIYTAPPNPPPLRRTEPEHFLTDRAVKSRDPREWRIEELRFDIESELEISGMQRFIYA